MQTQLKDTSAMLEEEQRQRDEQHGLATKAEKKANDLQLELEELRGQVEQVSAVLNQTISLAPVLQACLTLICLNISLTLICH